MGNFFTTAVAKLKAFFAKPSTHADLAILLSLVANHFPQYQIVIWTVAGLFGITSVATTPVATPPNH